MPIYRIVLGLQGLDKDDGHVRFPVFIDELMKLSAALNRADEIAGDGQRATYFRVVGLSYSSPAAVELEACVREKRPDQREKTLAIIRNTITTLESKTQPRGIDPDLLADLRNFAAPSGEKVGAVTLRIQDSEFEFSKGLVTRIDAVLGDQEECIGTLDGMLEQINVHAGTNTFTIYPEVGPAKVTCHFPKDLVDAAFAAGNRRVAVTGKMRYHRDAPFPHQIEVEALEVYPAEGELATADDLLGIAPDATGELSSEEFVRELRRGWQ